ncbi:MAG: diaminopimelate epimerase [Anaerolineae bacterium]
MNSEARFFKYQALGNDMVVIDPARCSIKLTPAAIRLICDRHLGSGADGICYGPLTEGGSEYAMRFFNPDGTEAEKSGNGLRIFARYLWDAGYVDGRSFTITIQGAAIPVNILDDSAQTITLGMGRLHFDSRHIPVAGPTREVVEENMMFGRETQTVTAVSIGNPHCVIFTDDLAPIRTLGPIVETAPQFPRRINVQLARVLDEHTLEIAIWERGAGYTLASGTSCSAAAGAAVKTGRCRSPIKVVMAGGTATVAIDEQWRVKLTGAVSAVYQGVFAPDLLHQLRIAE